LKAVKAFITFDDFYSRAEWVAGVPSSSKIRPEEDLNVLASLEDSYLPVTLFIPGKTVEKFPEEIRHVAHKHEVACHGYEHENMRELSFGQQRLVVSKSLTAIKEMIGQIPVGWRSPYFSANENTYRILSQFGFQYVSDYTSNCLFCCFKILEQLIFGAGTSQIRHLKNTCLINVEVTTPDDYQAYYMKKLSPDKTTSLWKRKLRFASKFGGLFVLCLHPWVEIENPLRLRALSEFLAFAKSQEGVEFIKPKDLIKDDLHSGKPSQNSMRKSVAL